MTTTPHSVDALLEDSWLDPPLLCRMAGVTPQWLHERVTLGVLQVRSTADGTEWRFDAADLRRVRRIADLERGFDAAPELAALVADLEDELAQLKARLHRLGVG
jgi:chaperone modulatory protein CbpM